VGLCTAQDTVPLEHVAIRAAIRGAQARVTIEQRYRNTEPRPIEAVYVFPLDEGAAVCGFAALVGDVRYEGTVKAREEAFARYDDAIAAGHGAFLLDEERPDVFTASIGNLAPGSTVSIELAYVTELPIEGDAVRFTLPTTVSPRYAPAEDRVGVGRPQADVMNPPARSAVPYGLSFSAAVHATGALRRIESPSHPVAVDLDGSNATITLAQEQAPLDRDLVLLITAADAAGHCVALERTAGGRTAVAVTFRPSFAAARVPSDVVFLVDRSGSMKGSSMAQVRNALQLCLRSLDPGCAFNIVGFGSSFESLFRECRAYDDRSLAEASQYIASLGATLGGTELLPALEFVLESTAQSRLLQLIVLTDGQVTNTDAVLDAVRRRVDRVRVFTFGIGRGASQHLVKGMARAGRGAAEFIHPGERIEPKVMRQFARALAPALNDVRIDWGGLRATPALHQVGPIFADETLRVYAWLDGVAPATVTLHGHGPAGPVSCAAEIRPEDLVEGGTVGTLAARARIREIEEGGEWSADRGSRQRERKQNQAASEVVRLGLEFGLASRETSWVAVEARDVPVTGALELRRVPIAITSGWGEADAFDPSQTGSFDLAMPLAGGLLGSFPMDRASGARRSTQPLESPQQPQVMEALVALQRADGSWDLDDLLAALLGLSLQKLEASLVAATGEPGEIRRAWATALALRYLELTASARRQEWKLIARKASRWLDQVSAVPPIGVSWVEYAARELV
jgi:Ca-activated chloride channel family protein